MFHKTGVASSSSAKDAALKKSEKRKLRDTLIRSMFPLFSEGITSEKSPSSTLAMMVLSEALSLQSGGDILGRKIKLSTPSSNNETQQQQQKSNNSSAKTGRVTLYLRTPCSPSSLEAVDPNNYWPYRNTTQPILLELEHEFIKDASTGATKQVLLPCLPLLSALPFHCLPFPRVMVYSQVSVFLCRGANLMRSGVQAILSPPSAPRPPNSRSVIIYPRGTVVTVYVINNPTPMALGVLVAAYPTEMRIGVGAKGICVDVITCFGDDLWNISKEEAKRNKNNANIDWEQQANYGNVGFVDGKVVLASQIDDERNAVNEQEQTTIDNSPLEEVEHKEKRTFGSEEGSSNLAETGCKIDNEEKLIVCSSQHVISITDNKEGNIEGENGQALVIADETTKVLDDNELPDDSDQDALLLYCFQRALVTTVTDKILPLPVSILYGSHILPARPPCTNLDLKLTKYKKIGTFLIHQLEDGIIQTKSSLDGRETVAFITKVNRNHPDLRKTKQIVKKHATATIGAESAAAAASRLQKVKKLSVVDLCKIPSGITAALQLNPLDVSAFGATSEVRRGTGFLTGKEVREIFNAYITREMLVDETQPANIKLNGPLTDILYKLTKKQQTQQQPLQACAAPPPSSVSRKVLLDLWISKLEPAYAIVAMPGSEVLSLKKGVPKKIEIEVEKRQGNKKFITRIRGLEEYGVDSALFANDVSRRFACASCIESNPVGRPALPKGCVECVFQGNLSEELQALLTGEENVSNHGGSKGAEYYVPKAVIVEVLRKGVPAKKKR